MALVEYCIDYLKRSEYLDQVYSPELLTLKGFKVSEALIQSSSDFTKAKNEDDDRGEPHVHVGVLPHVDDLSSLLSFCDHK